MHCNADILCCSHCTKLTGSSSRSGRSSCRSLHAAFSNCLARLHKVRSSCEVSPDKVMKCQFRSHTYIEVTTFSMLDLAGTLALQISLSHRPSFDLRVTRTLGQTLSHVTERSSIHRSLQTSRLLRVSLLFPATAGPTVTASSFAGCSHCSLLDQEDPTHSSLQQAVVFIKSHCCCTLGRKAVPLDLVPAHSVPPPQRNSAGPQRTVH